MKRSQKPPNLFDIIHTWMKKELPKALHEVIEGPLTPVNRITIMKKTGKTKRPCFMVELQKTANSQVLGNVGYMVIKTNWSSLLAEEAEIKHDKVVWGKWNEGAVVMAADPEFFQKMTLYMTRAAMVVTMGDFSPNIPEAPDDVAV